MCLRDLQVRIVERGVAEPVAKLIQWLHVVVIERAVVHEDPFCKVLLGDTGIVRFVEKVGTVVCAGHSHGEGKFGAGVDAAVEDVGDRVTRLLTGDPGPEDGGDVWVSCVLS